MSKTKIVSIIPARSGSKRIKNKNIVELAGQPLIAYTILDSLRVKNISRTIVSTDSKEIATIAEKYGAEVPFLRPKKLANDEATDLDWVLHFINWYKDTYKEVPDYLVHLRPTTPIREPTVIDEAIGKLLLYKEASSLRSLEELPESPYKTFRLCGEYLEPFLNLDIKEFYNLPNQVFPKSYKANGYVDILKVNTILQGSLHGNSILGYITPKVPEIDTVEDLEYCEYFLEKALKEEETRR